MNDNRFREVKLRKRIFIAVTVSSFLLPFIIFGAVYFANIYQIPIYEKKDILAYYSSIVGACFTGFITAGGLYFTLYENTKTFNEQRKIDYYIREEEKINSVMPVLKIGIDFRLEANMWLKTNHEFESTSASDKLRFYIKNIGVGPALNLRVKIGGSYLNNLYNLDNIFDLGVNELISIDVKTKFDKIERIVNENKHINVEVECSDVYNKRTYKYFFVMIKTNRSSLFETVIINNKEVLTMH